MEKVFKFKGHCVGETKGFPEVIGTYTTQNNGDGVRFLTGPFRVGAYIRVWEHIVGGNGYEFAKYQACYCLESECEYIQIEVRCPSCGDRRFIKIPKNGIELICNCGNSGKAIWEEFPMFGRQYGGEGQVDYVAPKKGARHFGTE